MADKKNVQELGGEEVVAKAKDFWTRNSKLIMIASTVLIVVIGGYYGYKEFVVKPQEKKASETLFKAEEYFRMDSVAKAVNGDGVSMGFARIADKYGSTKAGKLAAFYAGSCYIKLNENEKAVKYLKKFSSESKQVQARAYKLLGDAYADLGKNDDALSSYKKAAYHFEKDEHASADYLFMAAYLADKVMKNSKEAIALYKEVKQKYPNTQQAYDAENYLAQLGVYTTDN